MKQSKSMSCKFDTGNDSVTCQIPQAQHEQFLDLLSYRAVCEGEHCLIPELNALGPPGPVWLFLGLIIGLMLTLSPKR